MDNKFRVSKRGSKYYVQVEVSSGLWEDVKGLFFKLKYNDPKVAIEVARKLLDKQAPEETVWQSEGMASPVSAPMPPPSLPKEPKTKRISDGGE